MMPYSEIISFFAGAFTSWFFTWLYYKRSARSLNTEIEKLQRDSQLILKAMEEAIGAEFNKDSQGRIIGLVRKLKGQITATAKVTGNLTVIRKDDK